MKIFLKWHKIVSMAIHLKYQSLLSEYQRSVRAVKKYNLNALYFQVGIWTILLCLKFLQVQSLNLIATLFFSVFFLSRVRNFNFRRRLDHNMTHMILEGVKLEGQNFNLGYYFNNILRNFRIIKALSQRILFDLAALYSLGGALFLLISEIKPGFVINLGGLYPIIMILVFFWGRLYTEPLKPFAKAKQELLGSSA